MGERWKAPDGVQVRKLTPQIKAAVMGGWIPIDCDPVERFTPEALRGDDQPVFLIRKPNLIDGLRKSIHNPEEARAEAERSRARSKKIKEGAGVEVDPADMAREIIMRIRDHVVGWENFKSASGELIPFVAGPDGCISDDSLTVLGRAWALVYAIYSRIMELEHLTDLEKEGFGSSPASITE